MLVEEPLELLVADLAIVALTAGDKGKHAPVRIRGMNHDSHDPFAEEFAAEIAALRDSQPTLTPLALDGLRQRIDTRATGPLRRSFKRRQGVFMRSRAAIIGTITAGVLMSSGGAALGLSGLASDGSAGIAQYGTTGTGLNSAGTPSTGTTGKQSTPAVTQQQVKGNKVSNTAKTLGSTTSPSTGAVESAQQVATTRTGTLPFTGIAAIPIVLIGLGLLGAGVFLRRRLPARQE
ncbi:MAG: hypothetical protein NVSMB51_18160 [Solirubrobacteraceae bacterium]